MTGKVRELFLTGVLIVLGILCFFCLVRSVRGPKLADRIMAVNMIGTMTMMSIAVLTVKLGEGFLADVALIYAMISFLAVVVVSKVYMGVHKEESEAQKKEGDEGK
ncbi:MAG: sodium:proton antiporter [Lachnospiraceae bacterium]|nr:sodium:proton antiporter [Lachnospiraceae bacterium]